MGHKPVKDYFSITSYKNIKVYCIILYYIIIYLTILYFTILCYITSIVWHCIMLYLIILYVILYYTILYYIILQNTTLYYTNVILYHIVYYIMATYCATSSFMAELRNNAVAESLLASFNYLLMATDGLLHATTRWLMSLNMSWTSQWPMQAT